MLLHSEDRRSTTTEMVLCVASRETRSLVLAPCQYRNFRNVFYKYNSRNVRAFIATFLRLALVWHLGWASNRPRPKPDLKAGLDVLHVLFHPDALLSNKGTKFSTMSFGAMFNLVFASLCLTTLQVVLAFYGGSESDDHTVLYGMVAGISILKLVASGVVRTSVPSILGCMHVLADSARPTTGYDSGYKFENGCQRQ